MPCVCRILASGAELLIFAAKDHVYAMIYQCMLDKFLENVDPPRHQEVE
jgi:hypothetical protein